MDDSTDVPGTPLHGVFPVCATPFTLTNQLDLSGLRRIVDLIVDSGAHGLVYPAIASEYQTLSDSERHVAVEIVSDATAGRLPLVIGVSATDPERPPSLAAEAAALNASAVMLMPPVQMAQSDSALGDLFSEVARQCHSPIILQNAPQPMGPALSTDVIVRLIDRVPRIRYVKEETPPCGHRITALLGRGSATLLGVFGGAGGRFMLEELARGAAGSMPACEFPSFHAEIYSAYRAGKHDRARDLSTALLPLLNLESVFRTTATKQILYQMGVIASPSCRDGNYPLDELDLRELSAILATLRGHFPRIPRIQ